MQNCELERPNLDDLLHGANPPQESLHDPIRTICAVATDSGFPPRSFRRALGGAEILWDTPDWKYALGLTAGIHLAKDYEGRLSMLCKDLDLPLL